MKNKKQQRKKNLFANKKKRKQNLELLHNLESNSMVPLKATTLFLRQINPRIQLITLQLRLNKGGNSKVTENQTQDTAADRNKTKGTSLNPMDPL